MSKVLHTKGELFFYFFYFTTMIKLAGVHT